MKKIIISLFAIVLTLGVSMTAFAGKPLLVDDADLLTSEQEAEISKVLSDISNDIGMDVAVVTTTTLEGKTPVAYADDYFDYNGFGQGNDRSGCVLLISMEDRDWHISTRGYAINCLWDSRIQTIGTDMKLSEGDYAYSLKEYAQDVKYYYELQKDADATAAQNGGRGPFKAGTKIIVSLIIGLIAGLIYRGSLKGQLKSVVASNTAADYKVKDSFKLNEERDIFLYSHTDRVAKPEPSSSNSTTHTSSSGATHGGGGGKF